MTLRSPYFGVIGVDPRETDYQLGAEVTIPRARNKFIDKEIQYNQKDVSPVSCTIHGAMGAVSDLTGFVFSLEDRKELWKRALSLGADPSIGWYTSRAVDVVRKFYNEKFPEKPLTSFRTSINSDKYKEMLDFGYTAVISHRGNSKYNSDVNIDGILDGTSFGTTTYGHCLRMASVGDEFKSVINNYFKAHKFNIYKVPTDNLSKLISNRVFFKDCYFFVDNYEVDGDIPLWAKASWDKAKEKGIVKAGEDFSKIVGTQEAEDHLIKLGIFSKREGNISLVRWVVALDLMGRLG